MKASVILNAGQASSLSGFDLILLPGENLITGEEKFREYFGEVTSMERDLLVFASAVYACDLATVRGKRGEATRDIELTVPVVNFQAFQRQREELEYILYVLSDDNWSLMFQEALGTTEPPATWPSMDGQTLLFSGGLDSLAAAVKLADTIGPAKLQLASHQTRNQTTVSSQENLLNYLDGRYKATIQHVAVRTGGHNKEGFPFPRYDDREPSQWTRSFTFLTIAAIAARRRGNSELVMIAENGQMALHVPLVAARIGSFSTHTAHPEFLEEVEAFYTEMLRHTIHIVNPYMYDTKAEVIAALAHNHKEAIPMSVSCWKSSRVNGHCGGCIPCYVRRIAVEYYGIQIAEYERNIFEEDVRSLPSTDDGKRNLVDLAEFVQAFLSLSNAQLEDSYPELLSEFFDKGKATEMYRRFAKEAVQVWAKYPKICLLPAPGNSAV